MNFLGWTNLHVSRVTGQLIAYYSESWSTTLYAQSTVSWDMTMHTTWHVDMTSQDQSYFFICLINYMRYNIFIYCPVCGGRQEFSGWNKSCLRLTGQLIVYYTESWITSLYGTERCAVRHDHETWCLEGDMKIWLLDFPYMFSLDQSYFFICHINYMRYDNMLCQFWIW